DGDRKDDDDGGGARAGPRERGLRRGDVRRRRPPLRAVVPAARARREGGRLDQARGGLRPRSVVLRRPRDRAGAPAAPVRIRGCPGGSRRLRREAPPEIPGEVVAAAGIWEYKSGLMTSY